MKKKYSGDYHFTKRAFRVSILNQNGIDIAEKRLHERIISLDY